LNKVVNVALRRKCLPTPWARVYTLILHWV